MACAAVLIPCHSHCAEALPGGILAEEVLQVRSHFGRYHRYCLNLHCMTLTYLQGPLLCAKLGKYRQLHWSAASSTDQVTFK